MCARRPTVQRIGQNQPMWLNSDCCGRRTGICVASALDLALKYTEFRRSKKALTGALGFDGTRRRDGFAETRRMTAGQERITEDDGAQGPLVLFDGFCNLCSRSIDFIMRRDAAGRFRFGALQSAEAREVLLRVDAAPDTFDSIVLVQGRGVLTHSDAVIEIARWLGFPWRILGAARVVPRPLRDGVYRWVAKNRYRWFGRRTTCRVPSPEEASRFLRSDPAAGAAHSEPASDDPDWSNSK